MKISHRHVRNSKKNKNKKQIKYKLKKKKTKTSLHYLRLECDIFNFIQLSSPLLHSYYKPCSFRGQTIIDNQWQEKLEGDKTKTYHTNYSAGSPHAYLYMDKYSHT